MHITHTYLFFFLAFCLACTAQAQEERVEVMLIQVNPELYDANSQPGDLTSLPNSEGTRVMLSLPAEGPLSHLNHVFYGGEVLQQADCFVPALKLVFRDVTYVVSTYCLSARKYVNTAPFQPSPVEVPNDLVFTVTLVSYLEQLQAAYFQPGDYREAYRKLERARVGVNESTAEEFIDIEDIEFELFSDLHELAIQPSLGEESEDIIDEAANETAAQNGLPMPDPDSLEEEVEKELGELDGNGSSEDIPEIPDEPVAPEPPAPKEG